MREFFKELFGGREAWLELKQQMSEAGEENLRLTKECEELKAKCERLEKNNELACMLLKRRSECEDEADAEAKMWNRKYRKLGRLVILCSTIVVVTVITLLCRNTTVQTASIGTDLEGLIYHQDGKNTTYNYSAPDVLTKLSGYDSSTLSYIEMGKELFLQPNHDYRIDVYVSSSEYDNFGNDIGIQLPAAMEKRQTENAEIFMEFADCRLIMKELPFVTTDDAAEIRRSIKVSTINTIMNDSTAVSNYLEEAGFERHEYSRLDPNLYHFKVYFTTMGASRSYTYTSMGGSVIIDIILYGAVCTLVLGCLYALIEYFIKRREEKEAEEMDLYFEEEDDEDSEFEFEFLDEAFADKKDISQ